MNRTIISLLSLIPLTFAACGGTDSGDCTASGGTNKSQYVINTVTVPLQRSDFSIDLNGDARVDNQLGQIFGTLKTNGLVVQDGIDSALTDGTLIMLLSESASEATFQTDTCATSALSLGKPIVAPAMPDYSGHGTFTADTTSAPSMFNGPVAGGKFNSAPPSTTTHPVTATILLPLVVGQTPVRVTLQGAHIQYTRSAAGAVTGGALQGGVKNMDVQMNIVPAVGTLLTNKLQHDNPQTSGDMQIATLFDTGGKPDASCTTGGCKNPTYGDRPGMCATAMDKIVDTCEVSTNNLVISLLAPDVQLFDATGAYKPNKDNTVKDSLSVGLAFTAVGASF